MTSLDPKTALGPVAATATTRATGPTATTDAAWRDAARPLD